MNIVVIALALVGVFVIGIAVGESTRALGLSPWFGRAVMFVIGFAIGEALHKATR